MHPIVEFQTAIQDLIAFGFTLIGIQTGTISALRMSSAHLMQLPCLALVSLCSRRQSAAAYMLQIGDLKLIALHNNSLQP